MADKQDKSNEEHGQLRQAGVSRSFSDVLRSFGFRRCKSYAKGITCFISACGHRYAEVYTETWGKWAWATGDGLPQDPGYPGGKAYHEPHRLHEVLSSCGLNPKEKDGIRAHWTFDRNKRELDKCILLCCRCHREVHSGTIETPHLDRLRTFRDGA